jgi:hypothetical protein
MYLLISLGHTVDINKVFSSRRQDPFYHFFLIFEMENIIHRSKQERKSTSRKLFLPMGVKVDDAILTSGLYEGFAAGGGDDVLDGAVAPDQNASARRCSSGGCSPRSNSGPPHAPRENASASTRSSRPQIQWVQPQLALPDAVVDLYVSVLALRAYFQIKTTNAYCGVLCLCRIQFRADIDPGAMMDLQSPYHFAIFVS